MKMRDDLDGEKIVLLLSPPPSGFMMGFKISLAVELGGEGPPLSYPRCFANGLGEL